MSRAVTFIFLLSLLISPLLLLAQHGGHRGQGENGEQKSSGSGAAEDRADAEAMNSFYRALAVQATPDQIAEFQSIQKTTNTAANELKQLREALSKSPDGNATGRVSAISASVEDARHAMNGFIKNCSKPQTAGLKDFIKRLRKADSELATKVKTLNQEAQKPDSSGISQAADQLERALDSYKQQQLAIANEMGVKT